MLRAVVNVVSELIIVSVIIAILFSAGFFMYGYLYVQNYEMQVASYVQKLGMYTSVGVVYYNGTSAVIQITQEYSTGVLYGFGILYVVGGSVIYLGNETWRYMSFNATVATINATTLTGWKNMSSYWVGDPSRVKVYPFYVKGETNVMFVALNTFTQKNITIPLLYVDRNKAYLVRVDNIDQSLNAETYLVVYVQVGYDYYGVLYIPLSSVTV